MNLLSLVGLRMDNICQIRRKWYYSSGSFLLQTKRGPGRSLFCLHGVPERSSHGRLKADATLSVQAAPQQAGSQVSARQSTKHNNPKLLCIIVALRGRPMKDAADKTYVRATTRVGGPGGERRHRWTRPGTSLSRLILFRIRDCRIWLAHMSVPARHCSCPGPRGGWSHVAVLCPAPYCHDWNHAIISSAACDFVNPAIAAVGIPWLLGERRASKSRASRHSPPQRIPSPHTLTPHRPPGFRERAVGHRSSGARGANVGCVWPCCARFISRDPACFFASRWKRKTHAQFLNLAPAMTARLPRASWWKLDVTLAPLDWDYIITSKRERERGSRMWHLPSNRTMAAAYIRALDLITCFMVVTIVPNMVRCSIRYSFSELLRSCQCSTVAAREF
jgi:hypothetical protein